jgi:hydroxymethylbilane synthase
MTIAYPIIRLGTRASPLAMAQAHMVEAALIAAHPGLLVEIMPVIASGDRVLDRALSEVGGKALWTKELDHALLSGEIDIAVHSMKDVETLRPPKLRIAVMLPRADVGDRLIGAISVAALPQNARVGTSAPRRTAQLLRLRPDLIITLFRGNVATRLGKLEAGEADATLLAAAGLDRLGMGDTGFAVPIETMLPAPAQGAVGIETLADNDAIQHILAPLNHKDTFECVMAERAFLAALSADCQSPVAALAIVDGDQIWLRAQIYTLDGVHSEHDEIRFARSDSSAPTKLANLLLDRSAPELRSIFG